MEIDTTEPQKVKILLATHAFTTFCTYLQMDSHHTGCGCRTRTDGLGDFSCVITSVVTSTLYSINTIF